MALFGVYTPNSATIVLVIKNGVWLMLLQFKMSSSYYSLCVLLQHSVGTRLHSILLHHLFGSKKKMECNLLPPYCLSCGINGTHPILRLLYYAIS